MLRMLPFLVFVVIVFMVALAVTRYFTSKGKREYAAAASELEQIKGLPVREAMTRVADLLGRGELLRSVPSPYYILRRRKSYRPCYEASLSGGPA